MWPFHRHDWRLASVEASETPACAADLPPMLELFYGPERAMTVVTYVCAAPGCPESRQDWLAGHGPALRLQQLLDAGPYEARMAQVRDWPTAEDVEASLRDPQEGSAP